MNEKQLNQFIEDNSYELDLDLGDDFLSTLEDESEEENE